jgi:hypothetical protein
MPSPCNPRLQRMATRNERVVQVVPGATSDWHDCVAGRIRLSTVNFGSGFGLGAAET